MRLVLQLCPNTNVVSFNYQHALTGKFHNWLGNNMLHDDISLYSLSWLSGGKRQGNALTFPDGATWFISAHSPELLHQICLAATKDTEVCSGMEVCEIKIVSPPKPQKEHIFKVASPVLSRGNVVDGKVKHYIYSDTEADAVLTQTLRHKLDKAGLNHLAADTQVRFDRDYQNPRTKLVAINGISNRASICPVIVEGPPEAVEFAWNVGIGHLTGSGFGALI